MSIEELWGLFE